MEIKIYFDDRVVVLTDKDIKSSQYGGVEVFVFKNQKALAERLERFEQSGDASLYISHPDLNTLFDCVKKTFKYVEAAGGLVMSRDSRLLIIKRLGKWDLPKGKVEKGETLRAAALREVMEECGLSKMPEITGKLTHSYHSYRRDDRLILKRTTWYLMLYDGNEELHPQYDEDITQAVWLPQNMLGEVMQNTYLSIKQVLFTVNNRKLDTKN